MHILRLHQHSDHSNDVASPPPSSLSARQAHDTNFVVSNTGTHPSSPRHWKARSPPGLTRRPWCPTRCTESSCTQPSRCRAAKMRARRGVTMAFYRRDRRGLPSIPATAHRPERIVGPETRGHLTSCCRRWRRRVSPQHQCLPAIAPQQGRPRRPCVPVHLRRGLALLPLHLAPLCPCCGMHPCHCLPHPPRTPFLRAVLLRSPRAGAENAPRTAQAAHLQTRAALLQPPNDRRQENAWPLVLQDPPGHAARQNTQSRVQRRGRRTRSLCFPPTPQHSSPSDCTRWFSSCETRSFTCMPEAGRAPVRRAAPGKNCVHRAPADTMICMI